MPKTHLELVTHCSLIVIYVSLANHEKRGTFQKTLELITAWQPRLPIKKSSDLNVHLLIIRWYCTLFFFLKINGTLSESSSLITGAPQGCVSAPVLFTLYTNECRSSGPSNYTIKFSDDTAVLARPKKKGDLSECYSWDSKVGKMERWQNHRVANV